MISAWWFGAPFGRGFARVRARLAQDGIAAEWRDVDNPPSFSGGKLPDVVMAAPEGARHFIAELRLAATAARRPFVVVDHAHYLFTRRALVAAGVLKEDVLHKNGHNGASVALVENKGTVPERASATPSSSPAMLAAIAIEKLKDAEDVERECRAFVRRLPAAYRGYVLDECERIKRADAARVAAREALAKVRAIGDDALIGLVDNLSEEERDAMRVLLAK